MQPPTETPCQVPHHRHLTSKLPPLCLCPSHPTANVNKPRKLLQGPTLATWRLLCDQHCLPQIMQNVPQKPLFQSCLYRGILLPQTPRPTCLPLREGRVVDCAATGNWVHMLLSCWRPLIQPHASCGSFWGTGISWICWSHLAHGVQQSPDSLAGWRVIPRWPLSQGAWQERPCRRRNLHFLGERGAV